MSDIISLFPFTDQSTIRMQFSPDQYSRFKYGSKSIARQFGRDLGTYVAHELIYNRKLPLDTQFVVASAPYMFIPTATFALKDYMISILNSELILNGYKPAQEVKVYRQTGYTEDYGSMSGDERKKVINSEAWHVDRDFLFNKFVIWLDDVRITGSHELRMREMMSRLKLEEVIQGYMFAYFAQLTDDRCDPTIEDWLNYHSIQSLLDLDKIIKNDEFIFNTRNVKYILGAPHSECIHFLDYQKISFLETLYHNSIGNSYHLEEKFNMNFQYLQYLINK